MEKSRAIELLEHLAWDRDIERNPYGDALNMAIEALKEQLSREGTTKGATSDMISKTETVEHLRRTLDATVPITDYDEGFVDGVEFGVSTVSAMPTIQPQSTTGQLNDGAQSTAQSTNLIDRQATIDAVNNAFDRETLLTGLVRSIAVRAIMDMPTIHPEPQWIPVSERLPEEPGYYITSNEYNGVGEDFYYDGHFWNADKNAYSVIAWMPKPKAYKSNK